MKYKKYAGNELKYLKKVLNEEKGPSGTWVKSLEELFAEKFEGKYAIAMNSGTSTIHAALEALGVGYGDEVISPALTVVMDTTTTLHANAKPVYVDVDEDTFNIDPKKIEDKITKSTKAIIAVSLYGLPFDQDPIYKIGKKYNIPIIEDHAQTMLSKYNNKIVGSTNSFSSWSFETTKHLSSGEGGILMTNNKKLAQNVRKIGGQGYKNLSADGGVIKFGKSSNVQNPNYKRHDTLGWNYRMNEFTAAVALAQLEQIEYKVSKRIENAESLLELINDCEILHPQKVPINNTHSYYTLACKLSPSIGWKKFLQKFNENGGDGFYSAWSVPYLEPLMVNRNFMNRYDKNFKISQYKKGECPVAEDIQSRMIQFKTNYLTKKEINKQRRALKLTINYFK
jgi:perosamine synthetase